MKISFGEVKNLSSGIYSLGKTHFFPRGKKHYPRGKEYGYPLVRGTLSSGKWQIIIWERKLIPSGKAQVGTEKSQYHALFIQRINE